LDVTGEGTFDESDQFDGHNVSGLKNESMVGDITPGNTDNGIILMLPNDSEPSGLEQIGVAPPNAIGSRSSWGIYRHDD
jgi:hypothetical protein